MTVLKRIAIIIGGLLVLVFAGIGLLSSTRASSLRSVRALEDPKGPPAVGEPLFPRTMELLTASTLVPGNRAELLLDGNETYPRLWQDLRGARRSITVQLYYMKPGRMADTLKAILVERARAGVRVLFLRDAFGAQDLTASYLDSLARGGVEVATLRPLRWYTLDRVQRRLHSRVVVVDGRVGYTGGFGIDDKWFGNGRRPGQWRDSNVRFEGPAVMQLQGVFAEMWAETTGVLLTGELFFPLEQFTADGSDRAGVLHTVPTVGNSPAARFLALSIAGAQRRLYISNPYFVPDATLQRMLIEAARRGVDVRILTAGDRNDVRTALYAGRHRYARLLAGGVRIYEYQPTMIHAKSLVADGLWSAVGTMNFDNRSMVYNSETNLLLLDRGVGARMDSIFAEDLRYAREIRLERFQRRGWWERLKEEGATALSRVL